MTKWHSSAVDGPIIYVVNLINNLGAKEHVEEPITFKINWINISHLNPTKFEL